MDKWKNREKNQEKMWIGQTLDMIPIAENLGKQLIKAGWTLNRQANPDEIYYKFFDKPPRKKRFLIRRRAFENGTRFLGFRIRRSGARLSTSVHQRNRWRNLVLFYGLRFKIEVCLALPKLLKSVGLTQIEE